MYKIGKNFLIENEMHADCCIYWFQMCYLAVSVYALSLFPNIYFISSRKKVYLVI